MSALTTCLTRLLRRLFPGRNPLARSSDRVEGAVLLLALLIPLVAVPFAVTLGSDAYARESRVAAVEATTRHETTAVLLADATITEPGAYSGGRQTVTVRGEWRLPNGNHRTGRVVADVGLRKGSHVPVWLDRSGQRVDAPRTATMVTWNAIAVAITVWLGIVVVSALGFWGVRVLLDRARWLRWQREWHLVDQQRHGL
ncbi:Rv1733c family protein [Prauserella cavernicola]|uniref:Uncharacterized protein n=1 Tax=Prauserella cavernicola TaxID=2800127 RepID=A0A934V1F7_9PSEU|nr:hypothetical protein [Prauserella cavernicola]MBK1782786.1 hypothetical protein [Prauserella cavernicola]